MTSFNMPSFYVTKAVDHNIVTITVREPFTLLSLRDSEVKKGEMVMQGWYVEYDWATKPIEPGQYHLRMPVPGSNNKTFQEQQFLLLPGEAVAPATLAAAGLLCIAQSGGGDPLNSGWVRCSETAHRDRVALTWLHGRLCVGIVWNDNRYDSIWLSSSRRSELSSP